MNLTHDQEMKLSELLHPYLDMGCWHDLEISDWTDLYIYSCKKCELDMDENDNPNLFHDWNGFGIVFDVVKDRGDWQEAFINEDTGLLTFEPQYINAPLFQWLTLEWLLEKDGRLGELEGVMGVGE